MLLADAPTLIKASWSLSRSCVAPGVGSATRAAPINASRLRPVPRFVLQMAAQSSSAVARASATDGGRALILAPASAAFRPPKSIPAARKASA